MYSFYLSTSQRGESAGCSPVIIKSIELSQGGMPLAWKTTFVFACDACAWSNTWSRSLSSCRRLPFIATIIFSAPAHVQVHIYVVRYFTKQRNKYVKTIRVSRHHRGRKEKGVSNTSVKPLTPISGHLGCCELCTCKGTLSPFPPYTVQSKAYRTARRVPWGKFRNRSDHKNIKL